MNRTYRPRLRLRTHTGKTQATPRQGKRIASSETSLVGIVRFHRLSENRWNNINRFFSIVPVMRPRTPRMPRIAPSFRYPVENDMDRPTHLVRVFSSEDFREVARRARHRAFGGYLIWYTGAITVEASGAGMRVIGVGNILLSDEGVGVHLANELAKRGALQGVDFMDGGGAGGALLNLIEDQGKVILLDCVAAPFPPGTVLKMFPDDLKRNEDARYSLHDMNLADTIDLMRLRGTLPEMMILGVVPADIDTYRIGLSDPLAERFEEILAKVGGEIEKFSRGAA
ncbi:MAG: hydrogenase maturation protease [Deltaproteobacteria bacterium]|nr:hydrogenase maturation protease [Deltaproteobacteria bacterium]